MKLEVKKLPIFCLTCETTTIGTKREHIIQEFSCMNNGNGVEFVMPITEMNNERIPKNKSGASGFIRMIEKGLLLQIPGEQFIPFLMIEDDVSVGQIPDTIDIPFNTDILYTGISCCSMTHDSFHYQNYYESVDGYPDVVRIQHMLASHGTLICSPLGASALQRTMMETWFSEQPWDVPMAYIQPYYNVYAVRQPIVYQNSQYGGDESCTRIEFNGQENPLPTEYIRCDFATLFVANKNLL